MVVQLYIIHTNYGFDWKMFNTYCSSISLSSINLWNNNNNLMQLTTLETIINDLSMINNNQVDDDTFNDINIYESNSWQGVNDALFY